MKSRINYNSAFAGKLKEYKRLFERSIMILIFLNVLFLVLESIPEIESTYQRLFYSFEVFSIIVFSVEYVVRLYFSYVTHPSGSRIKSAIKFMFSFYGLIDLLAILPFFLPLVLNLDLRFLRLLRFIRFLRIFKLARYNKSINLIVSVAIEKKTELAVTGFITFVVLLFASFLMYYVEGAAQPDKFPNVVASFWWAIATLTTVGYGDVYPITPVGKLISGVIAVVGIGLVALPTGIISSGFMEKIKNQEKKCPHCGKKLP